MSNQVRVGDIGSVHRVRVRELYTEAAIDLDGATVHEMVFSLPNRTSLTRVADITDDGTDWFLEYTVLAADLTAGLHATVGTYRVQGRLVLASGETFSTDTDSFLVKRNL